MKNVKVLLSLVMVLTLLFVAFPGAAQEGEIAVAIGGDPSTLDPQAADDGNERAINDNIYETLLTRDNDMNIEPLLAESFEQLDETTWQFVLKEGISFTNGEAMNADAVVHSVDRIIDPEFNSEQLSFYETITGAEAVDDLTVNIMTNGPDPILPARMYWMKIVPPMASGEEGFAENPIGTGPYTFVSWERGQAITLEANADYWGGAPSIGSVVIRPIPEEATRLAALQAGEVDFVRDLIPEQIDQAPVVKAAEGLEFPIVRLNNKEGILTDVLIRQAINYAIDKEAIAEALYSGYASVADGQVLNSSHFGYNPDVEAYPYDPEMAASLLEEAGYDGTAIQLVGENGRWLKDGELIEVLGGMMTEVGINVDVQILEWSNYLDALFAEEGQPDMIFVGHDNTLFDADRTFSGYYSCLGRVSSYCNEEVTALIESGRTETDVTQREADYHSVVELSREDGAFLFLVNLQNIYGMSERLEWEPRQDGKIFFAQMSLK